MKKLLLSYLTYNLWANRRLLDFMLDNCNDEQVHQEIQSSFSSIRKTYLHVWGAESVWLMRMQAESPASWIWMDYTGSLSELRKEILDNNEKWIAFVERVSEAQLSEPLEYQTLDGKKHSNSRADIIMHCMNHSTFHRGQLITMLRQLGFTKLVATDYIAYLR